MRAYYVGLQWLIHTAGPSELVSAVTFWVLQKADILGRWHDFWLGVAL